MRFYNTKTGITLDLPLDHPGGDWALAENGEEAQKEEKQEEEKQEEKVEKSQKLETVAKNYQEITKKDIQQELDAFGVSYNPKAKKEELYQLMKERLHGENNR